MTRAERRAARAADVAPRAESLPAPPFLRSADASANESGDAPAQSGDAAETIAQHDLSSEPSPQLGGDASVHGEAAQGGDVLGVSFTEGGDALSVDPSQQPGMRGDTGSTRGQQRDDRVAEQALRLEQEGRAYDPEVDTPRGSCCFSTDDTLPPFMLEETGGPLEGRAAASHAVPDTGAAMGVEFDPHDGQPCSVYYRDGVKVYVPLAFEGGDASLAPAAVPGGGDASSAAAAPSGGGDAFSAAAAASASMEASATTGGGDASGASGSMGAGVVIPSPAEMRARLIQEQEWGAEDSDEEEERILFRRG